MSPKFLFVLAAVLSLGLTACGKKEDAVKSTTANTPPGATTPGTVIPGTAPGATTQPTSATPTPQGSGSVTPRNFTIGTAIAADKKVSVATNTLTSKETAYASLDLYGAGDASVRALWNHTAPDGKATLVKSDTETVKVTAPMTLEFHLAKPEGLLPGRYDIEIFVNEAGVGKKSFTVK